MQMAIYNAFWEFIWYDMNLHNFLMGGMDDESLGVAGALAHVGGKLQPLKTPGQRSFWARTYDLWKFKIRDP